MEETENKRNVVGDTRKASLWVTNDYALQEFKKRGSIEACNICLNSLDMTSSGWTKVGEVEVRITALVTGEELIAREVSGLKAQIEREKKDSASRVAWLEDKLANLLCLPAPKEPAQTDPCEWSEE